MEASILNGMNGTVNPSVAILRTTHLTVIEYVTLAVRVEFR